MEGARIGILLGAGRAHAALVGDGEARHATGPNASERVLARMLRGLANGARVGSVTWDVSAELDPALAGTPVAAVRVVPRLPTGGLGSGHPSPLLRSLQARRGAVIGGHDLFGVELAPLDIYAVLAEAAAARDIPALAVTASGAPGCADHELAAAELVHDTRPEARVSLSHQVGGLGRSTGRPPPSSTRRCWRGPPSWPSGAYAWASWSGRRCPPGSRPATAGASRPNGCGCCRCSRWPRRRRPR